MAERGAHGSDLSRAETQPVHIIYARTYSSRAVVRRWCGVYDSAMQYEDDVAFQRAILAHPTDMTLKLVYADWLQERDDPRAEFVRLQVQLYTTRTSTAAVDAAAWFLLMGNRLDPDWVAFMRKSFGKS